MEDKIDIVMIWVDGADKDWQSEKIKYSDNPEAVRSGINRYRDWGLLRYWFRGVEKFAPWVNNIYFITCGHYPKWLNLNHPKLKFVRHDEYIPKEYLPTFSANPIELNFHRIKELSDKFIYFNDDMFIINTISKEDFFKNGKPRFVAGSDATYSDDYNDVFSHILLNDLSVINKHFDKKKVIKENFFKWFNLKYDMKTIIKTISLLPFNKFSSMVVPHLAMPILKSTIQELWDIEGDILDKTSRNKFRSKDDVNQHIFSFYDIAKNNFEPSSKKLGKYYDIKNNLDKITSTIEKQNRKIICFSDDVNIDFEKYRNEIENAFEKILPDKSGFEI